ncbi:MAG: diversity-generating retroelement protein Avd [Candidatus Pacebacteria bacterium]|nr:diversity-generating retroelement protein Avd [Candidatus Paceibacterota bacterium]
MARYQHLPIFQSTYDLTLEIHKRANNFPRMHRHSIGEKIKNTSIDLLDLIVTANSAKNKTMYLENAQNILEKLKIYIRICFDLKILGQKGFEFLTRKIDEIGRQLNKWKEWSTSSSLRMQ